MPFDAIVGETVSVRIKERVGCDRFGDDVLVTSRVEEVRNVLVNPSTTTYDRIQDGHPDAMRSDMVLYFPVAFDEEMRGAQVLVRGRLYDVVGSPSRYTDANLPAGCPWNLVVKVTRHDG